MKTISFEGASDDLIEIDGDSTYDEINYLKSQPWTCVIYDDLSAQALRVVVWYGPGGNWFVGASVLDETETHPDWPVRIGPSKLGTRYSFRLEVDVPDGAYISDVSFSNED